MEFIEKHVTRSVFSLSVIDIRPGYIAFKVQGQKAFQKFKNEAGGQRFQRVPPTEKSGRRQTSTITVVVLKEVSTVDVHIDPKELEIKTCRGSGAGGQHRNVTDSAVTVKHKPSGIVVRCENERSQHQNKENALSLLRAKLFEQQQQKQIDQQNATRKKHVGKGMRGDKIRTIRMQDGVVINHITGKKSKLKDFLRGDFLGK